MAWLQYRGQNGGVDPPALRNIQPVRVRVISWFYLVVRPKCVTRPKTSTLETTHDRCKTLLLAK